MIGTNKSFRFSVLFPGKNTINSKIIIETIIQINSFEVIMII